MIITITATNQVNFLCQNCPTFVLRKDKTKQGPLCFIKYASHTELEKNSVLMQMISSSTKTFHWELFIVFGWENRDNNLRKFTEDSRVCQPILHVAGYFVVGGYWLL